MPPTHTRWWQVPSSQGPFRFRVAVPSEKEPVEVQQVKDQTKIEQSAEDALLATYIRAARRYVEQYRGEALLAQTLQAQLERFPQGDHLLELARPPLIAVESVSYYDSGGVLRQLDDFQADALSRPVRLAPAPGECWPEVQSSRIDAVSIRYRCGYAVPFEADEGTDTLSAPGHGLADGDDVWFSNSGGALPAPLAPGRGYTAAVAAGSSLKVSDDGGASTVDLADAGTGTHFIRAVPENLVQAMLLLVAHWYKNREAVDLSFRRRPVPVPMSAKALLDSGRRL